MDAAAEPAAAVVPLLVAEDLPEALLDDDAGDDDNLLLPSSVTLAQASASSSLPPPLTLYEASARGDLATVRRLVEVDAANVNESDKWDASPLYYACLCGHIDVVRYLLERGASCAPDVFDGERAWYAALNDSIRALLSTFQAANKQRGPLFAFLFRIFNAGSGRRGRADVVFRVGAAAAAADDALADSHNLQSPSSSSFSPPPPPPVLLLPAHRAILAARSPVLRAHFGPGGRWHGKREVRLTDPRLDPKAFAAVLAYLYTERLVCPAALMSGVRRIATNLRLSALEAALALRRAEDDAAAAAVAATAAAVASSPSFSPSTLADADRIVALDLGPPYRVGSAAAAFKGTTCAAEDSPGDAVQRLRVSEGMRAHAWRNLLRGGVVPEDEAFAAADDEDTGESDGEEGPEEDNNDGRSNLRRNLARPPRPSASASYPDLHHDVEICVRGVVFRAHTAYVCGRSPYLEGLLSFESAAHGGGGAGAGLIMGGGVASSGAPPEHTLSLAPPQRVELDGLSPFVFGVLLEWIYCDVVRPLPTAEVALEAIAVADAFLITDGLKAALVAQAIRHIALPTAVPLLAAGDLYQLRKLTEAAARFVAVELEAVLALRQFADLVHSSARTIRVRQEFDSIPIIDDIKTAIAHVYAGKGAAYAAGSVKGVTSPADGGEGHEEGVVGGEEGGEEAAAHRPRAPKPSPRDDDTLMFQVFTGRTRGAAALAALQARAHAHSALWKIALPGSWGGGKGAAAALGLEDEDRATVDELRRYARSSAEVARRLRLVDEFALGLGYKLRR
jgi:hypothetical protein